MQTIEKVFNAKKIKKRDLAELENSSLWIGAKHLEDVIDESGYIYTVHFDGLIPMSVSDITELKAGR